MHQKWCPAHPNNIKCECFRPFVDDSLGDLFAATINAYVEREHMKRRVVLDVLCSTSYYTTCPESLKPKENK